MRVWLLHLGELLPIDGPVRLYRYGILAEMLAKAGYQVTRWAPTFVHLTKKYRAHKDSTVHLGDNHRLKLIHAPPYRRHVGWARHRFHQVVSQKFAEQAKQECKPDLIISAMPVPEMCEAAISYGKLHDVPVVIDIRDLWPDVLLDRVPTMARGIAKKVLSIPHRRSRRICRSATAIVGISEGFLQWGLNMAQRKAGQFDRVFPMGRETPQCHGEQRRQAEKFWDDQDVRNDDRFRICFFGTMASLFDLDTVIQAARNLERTHGNRIQFVLCGDGPERAGYLRRAAGISNLKWPGWVSADQITVLMERSNVGIAPYLSHVQSTLPNKAVDYMSAGLPILGSSGGELASLVAKRACGIAYSSGDPTSFCSAVSAIEQDPFGMKKMGANGFEYFCQHLEANQVYGSMMRYFEELVQTKQQATALAA